MDQTLGCALVLAITGAFSFYLARGCLQGVVYLIHRTVREPSPASRPVVPR